MLDKVKLLQQRYPFLPVMGYQYCTSPLLSKDGYTHLLRRVMKEYITFPILLSNKNFPKITGGTCCVIFRGLKSPIIYQVKEVDSMILDDEKEVSTILTSRAKPRRVFALENPLTSINSVVMLSTAFSGRSDHLWRQQQEARGLEVSIEISPSNGNPPNMYRSRSDMDISPEEVINVLVRGHHASQKAWTMSTLRSYVNNDANTASYIMPSLRVVLKRLSTSSAHSQYPRV
nr:uncharacterized protein LOC109151360 isoform X1 [Ipomoea batatas]